MENLPFRYAWQGHESGRIHLLDDDGRTLCQIEKTGVEFPLRSSDMPVDLMGEPIKPVCANCLDLEKAEPSLKVLMGEAMA